MEFWSPATAVRSWRQNLLKMLRTSGDSDDFWWFWWFRDFECFECLELGELGTSCIASRTILLFDTACDHKRDLTKPDQMTRPDVHFLPSVQRDLGHCLTVFQYSSMCYIMTISKYEKYCPQDWWTLEGSHKQPRATRAAARRLAFIAKNLDPKKRWTSTSTTCKTTLEKQQS